MSSHEHNLVQFSIGVSKYARGDDRLTGIEQAIKALLAVSDRAEGVMWTSSGMEIDPQPHRIFDGYHALENMSVWQNWALFDAFVKSPEHKRVMAMTKLWDDVMVEGYTVMWWQANRPTFKDAYERLAHYVANGSSSVCFDFHNYFDAPL